MWNMNVFNLPWFYENLDLFMAFTAFKKGRHNNVSIVQIKNDLWIYKDPQN